MKSNQMMNSRLYDVLKPIATTVLPGIGALYFALAQIWGLPRAEEVVGTIAAVNVFLGLLLNISSVSYNRSEEKFDGSLDVEEMPDGKKLFSLGLNTDPYELENKDTVLFKVNKQE